MRKIIVLLLLIIPINAYAYSGIVMDMDSGRILYKNNINDKKLIASTTKIMTCIIVLENSNIEDYITVGDEVLKMYGTNIYIEKGERLKIIDLLYGLMLRSGNDAAETLAYNTLGYEEFINKMNEKAKEIGMNNTIFSNPHGLDEDTENYSTAYDMALLAKYAYKNKIYRKIISTKKYTTKSSTKSYVFYNRMSLLNNYKYCIGGKNGYTPKAGKSLVSYARKGDLLLIIVTLDDSNIYENHKYLYNLYFSKYKNYRVVEKGNLSINNNLYYVNKAFIYPLTESESNNISTLIKLTGNTGKMDIYLDRDNIGSIKINKIKNKKKKKKNLLQRIFNLSSR